MENSSYDVIEAKLRKVSRLLMRQKFLKLLRQIDLEPEPFLQEEPMSENQEICRNCSQAEDIYSSIVCCRKYKYYMPFNLEAKCFSQPKKKVKKTIWLNLNNYHRAVWHESQQKADQFPGKDRFGNRAWPLEIEVEE